MCSISWNIKNAISPPAVLRLGVVQRMTRNKLPQRGEGLEFYSQLCFTICMTSRFKGLLSKAVFPSKFWVITIQLLGNNKSTSKQRK